MGVKRQNTVIFSQITIIKCHHSRLITSSNHFYTVINTKGKSLLKLKNNPYHGARLKTKQWKWTILMRGAVFGERDTFRA